jgi:DNA modification methylase
MKEREYQLNLPFEDTIDDIPPALPSRASKSSPNDIRNEDRRFHEWYRFVLSFPPHLVRDYMRDFELDQQSLLLDPFCDTGTTLVEAKLNQIRSVGLEANPFPQFASSVKTTWDVNPDDLLGIATTVSERAYRKLDAEGIDDRALKSKSGVALRSLSPEAMRAIINDSISPLPLHKTLVLVEEIEGIRGTPFHKYAILALGKALVSTIGNLRFGPEVGVGMVKQDAPVVSSWLHEIRKMVNDLRLVDGRQYPQTEVHLADARELCRTVPPNAIDAVITSPPYPNEKDYTRTTRLETVVLGFAKDISQLRSFKKTLLRSNTRGVYTSDNDDQWVADIDHIQRLADEIETRRIELGKTSGFERLYGRVTKLYFGGMARHLHELTYILKPGAKLAYVVGDQASYLQIMIRTGQLLADIAERQGYQVERIDLFRTRFATATQNELREEVVILKWPGVRPMKSYCMFE